MPDSEGIVVDALEDGKAKVMIQASDPCIHCAEDLEVCNCSGGSARVMVTVMNAVGASAGDLVTITHKPGAQLKSILIFLVIPTVGMIAGLVVGALLKQRYLIDLSGTALLAAAGLCAGVIISVLTYKRMSTDIQPFIGRVITSGLQVPSSLRVMDPVCKMAVDPATAAGRMSYGGKTYYFCQPGCLETFTKDPATYI